MLALAGGLALRRHDEGDEARPRPERRHAADLPGRAERGRTRPGRRRGHRSLDRDHPRPRRRPRRLRAGDRPARRPIRSRSASRTSRTPSGRSSRSARRRSSTSTTSSRTSSRSTRRRIGEVTPTNLTSSRRPSLYDAVELASKQKPDQPATSSAPTTAPAFYLFEKQSRQPVAGPEEKRSRPLLDARGRGGCPQTTARSSRSRIGTIVVEDQENTDSGATTPPRYFVLRDRPALSGEDLTNPEQNFDQNNQPNVTFDFTDEGREAFQRSPRTSPSARPGEPQPALFVRDRPRRRDRLAAGHRLRGEPGRASTAAPARRSPALRDSRRRRTSPSS